MADGTGGFGAALRRTTWALSGSFSIAPLDPVLGADVGAIGSTEINTYLSLGGGGIAAVGLRSPSMAPGASWVDFSGFLPTTKHPTYDWVAIRGPVAGGRGAVPGRGRQRHA